MSKIAISNIFIQENWSYILNKILQRLTLNFVINFRSRQHKQLLPEHQKRRRAHLLAALHVHQVAAADQGQPEPQPIGVRQVAAHLDADSLGGSDSSPDDPGAVPLPRHGVPYLRLQHAPSGAAVRHLRRPAAADAPPGAHLRPTPALGQSRWGIVLRLFQAQLQVQQGLPSLAQGQQQLLRADLVFCVNIFYNLAWERLDFFTNVYIFFLSLRLVLFLYF